MNIDEIIVVKEIHNICQAVKAHLNQNANLNETKTILNKAKLQLAQKASEIEKLPQIEKAKAGPILAGAKEFIAEENARYERRQNGGW